LSNGSASRNAARFWHIESGVLQGENILVVLRNLWSSNIFRPSNEIYMCLSVGEPGVGIFLIRKRD